MAGALANAQHGSLCTDAIVIPALPYTTSDDTANYLDMYDPQTTTSPSCSATTYGNFYHSGNDVIYTYTALTTGAIKVEIPAALAWTGMFIYTSCDDIGIAYAACATGPSAGARVINNFAVTAGQTIYIYISSWTTPQTVAYTLNVNEIPLANTDFKKSNDLVLYPNPASNHLYVETDVAIQSVSIYDANGRRTKANMVAPNEIGIDKLQSGLYIAELITSDGVKTYRKFTKTK